MLTKSTSPVAVVTGGSSGIGANIVERLHRDGARVWVLDLKAPEVAATRLGVGFRHADVTDPESVRAAVEEIEVEHGAITVAVANAGIPSVGTAGSTTLDEWNRVLAVNLTGAWTLAAAVLPGMQRCQTGAIVNVASVAALVGMRAVAAYTAAKAGVVGLTRQMAVDYARDGIRVNAVCPGLTMTPLLHDQYQKVVEESAGTATVEDRIAVDLRNYPMRRLGEPSDISAMVAFLVSPDAAWVTGTIVPVDGGYTAT